MLPGVASDERTPRTVHLLSFLLTWSISSDQLRAAIRIPTTRGLRAGHIEGNPSSPSSERAIWSLPLRPVLLPRQTDISRAHQILQLVPRRHRNSIHCDLSLLHCGLSICFPVGPASGAMCLAKKEMWRRMAAASSAIEYGWTSGCNMGPAGGRGEDAGDEASWKAGK
jgi:hypothetical protein